MNVPSACIAPNLDFEAVSPTELHSGPLTFAICKLHRLKCSHFATENNLQLAIEFTAVVQLAKKPPIFPR
jgi:hypothetical protein